jgi:hypothetical protein
MLTPDEKIKFQNKVSDLLFREIILLDSRINTNVGWRKMRTDALMQIALKINTGRELDIWEEKEVRQFLEEK